MEKESFMSQEVASILNESFIPIKLDREERPDIDDVYMNYVQATTGSGGWPLNVFLTPDLEPVFGGTYWPGPNSTSLPGSMTIGFVEILDKLRDVWRTQQQRCRDSAKEITRQLREFAEEGTHAQQGDREADEPLDLELLEEAYQHFASRYDSIHGGFSRAPKFPTPTNLAFLLRLGSQSDAIADIVGREECEKATAMAVSTLVNMARGGIRDHIGHGFARYSVTSDWSLPHFEKMLYDQAQLLDVYVDAFKLTHDAELLGAVYDLVMYLTSAPVQSPTGGFHSSEDADSLPTPNDSEKREGAFYVWTLKELTQVLGQRDAGVCARHWGFHPDGNVAPGNDPHDEFMDQNVLSVKVTPSKLAKEFGLGEDEVVRIIKSAKQKLREYRERTRARPDLDDKIIVAWNGLAIGALAKCSALFEEIESSRAMQCRDAAARAIEFIRNTLFEKPTGQLWRVYRDGSRGGTPGFADDYAYLTSGLLNMYEATFDDSYLQFAEQLQSMAHSRDWYDRSILTFRRIPQRAVSRVYGRHASRILQHTVNDDARDAGTASPAEDGNRVGDTVGQRGDRAQPASTVGAAKRRGIPDPIAVHVPYVLRGNPAAPVPVRRTARCGGRAEPGDAQHHGGSVHRRHQQLDGFAGWANQQNRPAAVGARAGGEKGARGGGAGDVDGVHDRIRIGHPTVALGRLCRQPVVLAEVAESDVQRAEGGGVAKELPADMREREL